MQEKQSGQIAEFDAGARALGHHRLGVIGDAESGAPDHRKIVGAVAHRKGFLEAEPKPRGLDFKRFELGLAPQDRIADLAGERRAVIYERVGLLFVEPGGLGHARGEEREPARNQQRPRAVRLHGHEQLLGAGIELDALQPDAFQRRERQTLQQPDAFAQGSGEFDLAAHGALGDGGDFILQSGEIGEFVEALAIDDGRIHIGDDQTLAPVRCRHHIDVGGDTGCRRPRPGERGAGIAGKGNVESLALLEPRRFAEGAKFFRQKLRLLRDNVQDMGETLIQPGNRPFDAVLIAGPTASGKSAAALDLARELGGVIVNADSMQVYRELRILSARPGEADMAAVPHRLYGHAGARERYSVGRYQIDAAKALAEVRAEGRLPIFTGGTGLYFAALTDGLADIPAIPADIRQIARDKLDVLGVAGLHRELAILDPETAELLRPSDPQRVLRAFEVFAATGRPLASWQREAGKPVLAGLRLAKFVLDVPRYELRERIRLRFLAMLEAGAREEVEAVGALDPTLPAAKILGLRELTALNAGLMREDDAITAAVTATRQFAKRQVTWFRHRMAEWKWVELSDDSNIITVMRQKFS